MSRHATVRRICSQLLRATSTPTVATASSLPRLQSIQSVNRQTRSYAAPRAPKFGPSYAEVYSLAGITPKSFEESINTTGDLFTTLTPERYYHVAVQFEQAIKEGSSPWSVKLKGDDPVHGFLLHEVACLIGFHRQPKSAQAFAVAMWASASDMGHDAATITLARSIIRSKAWGRKQQLSKVEARFKQLVASGTNPDALTAEGELQYEQGKYAAASRVLERALALDVDFEWRPQCQLWLARAYRKLGRTDRALELLESMGSQGPVEADAELATMLKVSEPEKAEQHLFTAAVNGYLNMYTHLSEMEFQREAEAVDGNAKRNHHLWAMEWARLADPKEKI